MAISRKSLTAQERLDRLRVDAKQRVAERGTVQFRLDKDSMLHLMYVADRKKVPVGTLVRMWMVEHLANEPKPV